MVIAVFDIGGSHISYGYFDVAAWRLIDEAQGCTRSIPTSEANSLKVLVEVAETAKALYGSSLSGLSLAVPAPFDYTKGVSRMRHKLTALHGVDLKRLLSGVTQVAEQNIAFMNDADAFLLGALFASGITTGRSVGITLGTGVGSAFADGTEILMGGRGVPDSGEIWNLPYGGGTVEDAISTRRLEGEYTRRTGGRQSVKSIAAAARRGEVDALEVLKEFGEELAQLMVDICAAFDPERILLGGGICSAQDLFVAPLLANRWCADRVSIVARREDAPLAGAAVGWHLRQVANCIGAAE